ncbi:MAG TPA: hypothetical protein VKP65_04065 [Rhodothermales bacterium]|nr:hypothetical protein [Rhodothermales bacterium]
MASNVIFFAWNRSIPGRETVSAEHFQEFSAYLSGQQQQGTIESFAPVFLNPHGGDLNGFFLIRGDNASLDGLIASEEWETHMTRAALHLEGSGAVRGVTGDLVMERMNRWRSLTAE